MKARTVMSRADANAVGRGGYGEESKAWGWGRITIATLAALALLVLAFGLFVVVQNGTGTDLPRLVRSIPSGIDRERTLPVDEAPPQPGQQLPSGGARGDVGPTGGTGGTVGTTGGMTGGPTGPSTSAPGIGGR